jgi:hypothetical protein
VCDDEVTSRAFTHPTIPASPERLQYKVFNTPEQHSWLQPLPSV